VNIFLSVSEENSYSPLKIKQISPLVLNLLEGLKNIF